MNVLVTGGAGFIGSHLVEALLARGDRVTVLDNFDAFYDPAVKRRNLAASTGVQRFRLVEGDICRASDVEASLGENTEVVVHLAARAGVRPSIQEPALYAQVNVVGTATMLEAARRLGVKRFVFGSSSSVYGARSNPPFREDDRIDQPASPYAATKAAGEQLCATFRSLYPLEIVALRFFTVYGPRQRPDLAIAKFSRLLLAGERLPFFGSGEDARDYTYVEDTVAGILAAVDRSWDRFTAINLGGSQPVKLRDLVPELEAALHRKADLDRLPAQPGDVPLTCADPRRAAELLSWSPRVPLRDGLARYARWLDTQ